MLHTVELISNFMASRVGKASKVSQDAHSEFNRLEASDHANRLYNILYDPASRLPNARRHDLLLGFLVDAQRAACRFETDGPSGFGSTRRRWAPDACLLPASPPGGPFGQRTVPRKNIS